MASKPCRSADQDRVLFSSQLRIGRKDRCLDCLLLSCARPPAIPGSCLRLGGDARSFAVEPASRAKETVECWRLLLGRGKFTEQLSKPGFVEPARPHRDHRFVEPIVLLDETEAV